MSLWDEPTLLAIPVFAVTLALEHLALSRRGGGYDLEDAWVSLRLGVAMLAVGLAVGGLTHAVYGWLWTFRLADFGASAWAWAMLPWLDDLCYYVFHRVSHERRLFWAAHVNHHSSLRYHLATALRQPPTEPLLAWIFWTPLPLLGFRPDQILWMQSVSLLYQYWIHTELIDRLGPLEWVLNTPSHHRVHHGSNAAYIDRNYGAILIIWDRLFGTFAAEDEPVRYGLTYPLQRQGAWFAAVHGWTDLLRDLRATRSLSPLWSYPGAVRPTHERP